MKGLMVYPVKQAKASHQGFLTLAIFCTGSTELMRFHPSRRGSAETELYSLPHQLTGTKNNKLIRPEQKLTNICLLMTKPPLPAT